MAASRLVLFLFLLVASVTADCPPGTNYEPFFNKCYKFFNTPAPFLSAEQTCNSIGGHLVAIQNAYENSYVSRLVSGAATRIPNYWIGLNLLMTNSWSWTANASYIYSNWANGQPITSNPCGLMRDIDSKWITGACNSELPFVCAIDPNSPLPGSCSPSICPNDAICSSGYTFYNGNCLCYKYFKTNKSFDKARTSCIEEGGTLATIPNSDVNAFLTSLPGIDCHGITCPSIGLYCTSSAISSCKWADGSLLGSYTNFHYDGAYHSTPPAYATPFVLIAAPPTDPEQRGAWEPQSDARTYICQKPSTRMSMLMTSWKKDGNNSNKIVKFAGKSRSDAN